MNVSYIRDVTIHRKIETQNIFKTHIIFTIYGLGIEKEE